MHDTRRALPASLQRIQMRNGRRAASTQVQSSVRHMLNILIKAVARAIRAGISIFIHYCSANSAKLIATGVIGHSSGNFLTIPSHGIR